MSDTAESYPTIRDFVFQDAQQKAFEIHLRGIKEYETERKKIYGQRMDDVSAQADKRLKEQMIEKKIYKSSLINHARMDKMVLRNDLVMNIMSTAQHSIFEMLVKDKAKYKVLLRDLIVKSLIDLFEDKVIIRCLKRDAALVQEVIPESKKMYESLLKKELGLDVNLDLSLNTEQYLMERNIERAEAVTIELDEGGRQKQKKLSKQQLIQKAEEDLKCFGGVLLTTQDKLITSKNTLDARIDLAYSILLPQIRQNLFT